MIVVIRLGRGKGGSGAGFFLWGFRIVFQCGSSLRAYRKEILVQDSAVEERDFGLLRGPAREGIAVICFILGGGGGDRL